MKRPASNSIFSFCTYEEMIFLLHAKASRLEVRQANEQQHKNGALCYPKLNFVVFGGKAFLMIKAGAINSSGLMLDPKRPYFWKGS